MRDASLALIGILHRGVASTAGAGSYGLAWRDFGMPVPVECAAASWRRFGIAGHQ